MSQATARLQKIGSGGNWARSFWRQAALPVVTGTFDAGFLPF